MWTEWEDRWWWIEGWVRRLLGGWTEGCWGNYLQKHSAQWLGVWAREFDVLDLSSGVSWLYDYGQVSHSLWASVFLSVTWK